MAHGAIEGKPITAQDERARAAFLSLLGTGPDVTDFFTARGTHRRCGECCSRFLPITPGELSVLERAIAERGITLREEEGECDLNCPLLGADRECMANDVRPMICRQYDCAEFARGNVKMHPMQHKVELVDLREALHDRMESEVRA